MIVSTKGIVLKSVKYGETSIITTIYTESHGLLSFIINGVRSSKAKNKAALFQPVNFLNLVFNYKEDANLLRLKEYSHAFIYQSLPFDIVKISVAQLLLEVIEQCIKEEEPNEYLYAFLENSFHEIDTMKQVSSDYLNSFLLHLTTYIGIKPDNNFTKETAYFNMYEGYFVGYEFQQNQSLPLNISYLWYSLLAKKPLVFHQKGEKKELLQSILDYYSIHISGFKKLKSFKIIELVFS